jgi:mono/diheme cytochrome c family protein
MKVFQNFNFKKPDRFHFIVEFKKSWQIVILQKFAKYMIQGKQLYTTHCSNCHQENGDGLGKLFPPLAKADYMLDNIPRSICVIKNGLKGEIKVNGRTYNQAMPALDRLTNLEIAEISSYIYNSWGNEKGMIELETVEESLSNCQ